MLISLFLLGMLGGMMIPFQTSINNRLSAYTRSPIYTSTISFGVGMVFLLLINLITNPHTLTWTFLTEQNFHYYWYTGGMIGLIFLTGNLLLLPRLGASLTVVISLSGQMVMGVLIDAFGWFDASVETVTWFTIIGLLFLFLGIILMNDVKQVADRKTNITFYFWLLGGFIIGFGPPIQTAINSKLGQEVNSSFMAALVSFTIGFIMLLIIKTVSNKSFSLKRTDNTHGHFRQFYLIGGALGAIYITVNIILMPYLGAALTTLAGMLGQMIIALIIDHFGMLGISKRSLTRTKVISITIIIIGIVLLRFL